MRHILVILAVIGVGSLLWSRMTHAPALPLNAGGWSMANLQTCAKPGSANFPLWPGTSGARQVCRAVYAGSPDFTLTVYVMPEGASGATAAGLSRELLVGLKQPGQAVFCYRNYLYIAESPNAEMNTLKDFAAAVEATLIRAD